MTSTDGLFGMFTGQRKTMSKFTFMLGLNLILAGIIILLFPEILVALLSLGLVVLGLFLLLSSRKSKRAEFVTYTVEE